MIAFEILQNGRRIVVAGADVLKGGTIHASVGMNDTSERDLSLTVFGVTKFVEGEAQSFLSWKDGQRIPIDQEITIRVVEVDQADLPESERDPAFDE